MLNLDSYYRVARQNLGAQIDLDGNGGLSAVRVARQDQAPQTGKSGIQLWHTADPARKSFCALLVEKHKPQQGQGRAGLAYDVIDALARRDSAPLSAAEVNSAKRRLGDGSGGETIKWLDSELTAADRVYSQINNLNYQAATDPRSLQVLMTQMDELGQEAIRGMMPLAEAERQLYTHGDKEQAKTDYLELYVSLKRRGGVLSEERPVSRLKRDEIDLAARALTGFLLTQDGDDREIVPTPVEEARNKLHILLHECRRRKLALSETAATQAALVLDVLHERGASFPDVKSGGLPKYHGMLEKVDDLKDQPGVDKKYMLRLKGEEGVKTIEIVSYNGFKGKLKRFWDWVSRNGLRENQAVMRELKNTCRDSGIFRSEDFDNEIWQPALEKAGISPKTSLTPSIIEDLLARAIDQAITSGQANDALSYGDLLPIYSKEDRTPKLLRDSLLDLLPKYPRTDEWKGENREKTLERISTETLYSIRNRTVADFVSRTDQFLSHVGQISENGGERISDVFLQELGNECRTLERGLTRPEVEDHPTETPVSDDPTLSSSS